MEHIIFLGILCVAVLSYWYKPYLGLIVLVASLVFFREGWHPDMAGAWTLYRMDIFNLHLTELIVICFFSISLINKKILGKGKFYLPPFTGGIILFLVLVVFSAFRGYMGGATLKSAFGYGEWRSFFFAMLMILLVPNILTTRKRILRFLNWIYILAFLRACQGVLLYLMGKGPIHATLKSQVVFWDSAENMLFAVLSVLAVAEFFSRRPVLLQTWVKLIACLPMMFSVIFSLRRNAWVQFGISLVLVFFTFQLRQKIKFFIAMFLILAGMFFWVFSGLGGEKAESVRGRLASFVSTRTDTNYFHLYDMYDAFLAIKEKPLFGGGFGHGFRRVKTSRFGGQGINPNIVHNTYLHLWLKMGLLGLAAFLLFWFMLITYGYHGSRMIREVQDKVIVKCLVANIFGILAVIIWGTDMVANTRVPFLFYTLFGILPSMIIVHRKINSDSLQGSRK
ncbi:O-antigen ligase family protein [bacterium]|nr:O-antigen ligase family protein [bacterium]